MNAVDPATQNAIDIQRAYYAETAHRYDSMHVSPDDAHSIALRFMVSTMQQLGIKSILDIGCGTGRGLLTLKRAMPDLVAVGVEPSADLRKAGYANGLTEAELLDGDAMSLAFPDASFDLVTANSAPSTTSPSPPKQSPKCCAYPAKLRSSSPTATTSAKAPRSPASFKQTVNAVGLWPMLDFIKTKGKGYTISEGDGLFYSYSVFNDYKQIRKACESVHLLNTSNAGANLYRSATHVALLGIKPRPKAISTPEPPNSPS